MLIKSRLFTNNAAAYVDNLRDEYGNAPSRLKISAGKFYKTRDGRKVGPMEKYMHHADYPFTVKHAFTSDIGKAWRADGTFSIERNQPHEADLIAEWSDASDDVPLRGVSPVEKPVVAPATTAEPDSKLLVTISADTSALDAEIDRVKRRLKKLAKRARKMGINLEFGDLRDAA